MEERHIILKRAKNALITRDFDLASKLYNSLLEREPENLELLAILANLFIKAGQEETAETYFKKILELSPNNVDALNSLGGICRRTCRYNEAIAYLQRALATAQKTDAIEYNLGFTYKSMGKIEEAINCFQSVITANPTDALAYNHLGVIYAAQKNYEKAVSSYRRGLQVDPNNPILQYNLAKSYEATGNYANAIAAYEIALRAKPGWNDAVKAYTEILLGQNRTDSASELVRNALGVQPDSAEFHCLLGRIFTRQDNYGMAESSLETAERLEPASIETLAALADVYEKDGRAAEAAEKILAAEKMDPDSTELLMQVIGVMISAGKMDACGNRLQKLQQTLPHDARVHDLTGQYYICTKRGAAALRHYEQIEQNTPRYTDHLFNAARRYAQMEQFEQAQKYVKAFIRKNSDDVGAWLLLGKIDETLGNLEDALHDYETAARVDQNNYGAKGGAERMNRHFAAAWEMQVAAELEEAERFDAYVSEADTEDDSADADYLIEENNSNEEHSESHESGAGSLQKSAAVRNVPGIPAEDAGDLLDGLPDAPAASAPTKDSLNEPAGNAAAPDNLAFQPDSLAAGSTDSDASGNEFSDIPAETDAKHDTQNLSAEDAEDLLGSLPDAPAASAPTEDSLNEPAGEAAAPDNLEFPPDSLAAGSIDSDASGNEFSDTPAETDAAHDAQNRPVEDAGGLLDGLPDEPAASAPMADSLNEPAGDAAAPENLAFQADSLAAGSTDSDASGNDLPDTPAATNAAHDAQNRPAEDAGDLLGGLPDAPAAPAPTEDSLNKPAGDAAAPDNLAFQPDALAADSTDSDASGNVFPDTPAETDTAHDAQNLSAKDSGDLFGSLPDAPVASAPTADSLNEPAGDATAPDNLEFPPDSLAAGSTDSGAFGNVFPDTPAETDAAHDTQNLSAEDAGELFGGLPDEPTSSAPTADSLNEPADEAAAPDNLAFQPDSLAAGSTDSDASGNEFSDIPAETNAAHDAQNRPAEDARELLDGLPDAPAVSAPTKDSLNEPAGNAAAPDNLAFQPDSLAAGSTDSDASGNEFSNISAETDAAHDAQNRPAEDAGDLLGGLPDAPAASAPTADSQNNTAGDATALDNLAFQPDSLAAGSTDSGASGNEFSNIPAETDAAHDAQNRPAEEAGDLLDGLPDAPAASAPTADSLNEPAGDAAALDNLEFPPDSLAAGSTDSGAFGNEFSDIPAETDTAHDAQNLSAEDAGDLLGGLPDAPAASAPTADSLNEPAGDAAAPDNLAFPPDSLAAGSTDSDASGNEFSDIPAETDAAHDVQNRPVEDAGELLGSLPDEPAAPALTEDSLNEPAGDAAAPDNVAFPPDSLAAGSTYSDASGNEFSDIPAETDAEHDTQNLSAEDAGDLFASLPDAPAASAPTADLLNEPASDAAAPDNLAFPPNSLEADSTDSDASGNEFFGIPAETDAAHDAQNRPAEEAGELLDGLPDAPAAPAPTADAQNNMGGDAAAPDNLEFQPDSLAAGSTDSGTSGNEFSDIPAETDAAHDAQNLSTEDAGELFGGLPDALAASALTEDSQNNTAGDATEPDNLAFPPDSLAAGSTDSDASGNEFSDIPAETDAEHDTQNLSAEDAGELFDGLPDAPAASAPTKDSLNEPAGDAAAPDNLAFQPDSLAAGGTDLDASGNEFSDIPAETDATNRLQEDSAMPPALSTVPSATPAVPPESLAPNQSALAQTQQLNDMLQKVNANAEQVMRAAEKTLYAADILADTAHTIENHKKSGESEPDTENQVPQNPPADTKSPQGDSPTAEASRGNEELLEQIAKMLPVIRRLLENKDAASKYEHEIMLFKRLRALGEHLPESKRDVFLSGKTRLLLDYLVARLSGKPGLLRMVKALRETDALGGGIDMTEGESRGIAGRELTRKVLGDLCALLPSLEDQTLAAALQSEWQTIEQKL